MFFPRMRKKNHPSGDDSFQAVLDGAGHFIGTQATGAGVYATRSAVDNRLHAFDIGFPSFVGTPVRVRDLDAEGHALVAKFALSHPLHLLAVTNFRLIHKHLI